MRRLFFAANWKMHKTVREADVYTRELRVLVKDLNGVDIVIAPPFTALHTVADDVRNTPIAVAGQDLYWEVEGAYTGEVSGPLLREAGAEYVIIGHSERRRLFGETDQSVSAKLRAAIRAELGPIVCVGETLDEREGGRTLAVLDRQIQEGLHDATPAEVAALVVAYEPVWAIGTGRNATPAQAQEAHGHIRMRLAEWFGAEASGACRVIYGGSVRPDNSADLAGQPDVDGALVGGASLDPRSFFDIVARALPRTV